MGEEKVAFSIKVFEGDMEDDVDKLKYAVKSMKEMYPAYNEYALENARHLKAKYDALVVAGFTDEQAIYLIQ